MYLAYMFLRRSFATECDYLINTRAKKVKGDVGKAWWSLILSLRSWKDSQCSYDVLLLLLSLKAIG